MKRPHLFLKDRLTESQIEKFKLFEDEELIFACREHWLPLMLRIIRDLVFGLLVAVGSATVFYVYIHSVGLAVVSFFMILLLSSTIAMRELIHWSLHMYIATTKQIIEVQYSPLVSHAINSVLLDQIRCTEIDVEMFGIIPELIGIGNVALTFDRPTHKEEFVIKNIRSPRYIANLLSAQIHRTNIQPQSLPQIPQISQPVWYKELKTNKYRFLGDNSYGLSSN